MSESATEKQLGFIQSIEDLTGVRFEGHTKAEAAGYISDNVDEFRRREELEGEYCALCHEGAGDRI